MMAATCPFSTTRSRPLRIFLPSTSTCRFLTSRRGILFPLLSGVFAVEIVGGRDAAHGGIGRGLEVGVLDASGYADLLGVGIVDDFDAVARTIARNAEIPQVLGAGVDELVRLGTRRRADKVAGAHRQGLVPVAILAGAGDDVEQLIHHMMTVERKRLLARRHHMHGAAKALQSKLRANAGNLHDELLAVATIRIRGIIDIDDGPRAGHGFRPHRQRHSPSVLRRLMIHSAATVPMTTVMNTIQVAPLARSDVGNSSAVSRMIAIAAPVTAQPSQVTGVAP